LFRTITVEQQEERDRITPGQIWGIILIIISSGLLIGVVFYFIKTGRQTKFQSAPAAGKKKSPKLTGETPDIQE